MQPLPVENETKVRYRRNDYSFFPFVSFAQFVALSQTRDGDLLLSYEINPLSYFWYNLHTSLILTF